MNRGDENNNDGFAVANNVCDDCFVEVHSSASSAKEIPLTSRTRATLMSIISILVVHSSPRALTSIRSTSSDTEMNEEKSLRTGRAPAHSNPIELVLSKLSYLLNRSKSIFSFFFSFSFDI